MKEAQTNLLVDPLLIAPAALQIDGYYVKEFSCSVRNDLDEKLPLALGTGLHIKPSQVMLASPGVKIEIGVGTHQKSRSKFRIMLLVESDEVEDAPYDFSLRLIGYFSLASKRVSLETSVLFHRNAVMLLYSAAREIIASVTARGPFPAFMLPTLTFSLSDNTWNAIEAKLDADEQKLAAKKRPRQLSASTRKPSKKGASKKK
jgi:preprotein translocase subunit SecB